MMARVLASPATVTAVRSPEEDAEGVSTSKQSQRLSLSKPSWIVRTQSGSRTERRRTAEIRCVVCGGAGKVDCHNCNGKGRTNCVHLEMLPRGEWPRWCKSCGGSGLGYCSRCLGTGEFRHPMGFRFLNRQEDDRQ
ncbi:PREDICTED: uncharacterized protein LOC104806480 isoform X1 [Tarenaya hassleriana]|uniref:uncharacterized protein LOC104806480 isoform X1 n=1 Tax=Tarenaya hassleriana TaxID=28532 RepID=UPI00053C2347|nr:PREDICTED: uncharacterized protein LOC104806480 isoform X1 [Tarenaya hassleriana]